MLALSNYQLYLYTSSCDMRKSFDGLSGLVRNEMDQDPLQGDIFVFFNRRRTILKLLLWDLTGFIIFHKRLEGGTFGSFPFRTSAHSIAIKRDELLLIMEGIELKNIQRRKRYFRDKKN